MTSSSAADSAHDAAVTPSERLLITLCTYNERDNLAELIREIHQHAPQADVLVVDDNSPDGTGELADQLTGENARVHVLHRPGKAGLGRATVAGFQWGMARSYDWLINMDADFSHPPRYLPALLDQAGSFDVVIASRYVPGGGVVGWNWRRKLMSRGINSWARSVLGLKTHDNSGSYRCYRMSKLKRLPLDRVHASGYAIQEELLYLCRQAGCTFVEVPFTFEERRRGVSKITLQEGLSALWVLLRLGLFGTKSPPGDSVGS
ncbi:MAG: polyprenol monophosphomannose synthase [Planctomycetaceae bacterium]